MVRCREEIGGRGVVGGEGRSRGREGDVRAAHGAGGRHAPAPPREL